MNIATKDDPALNPFPWYRQMRESDPVHYYDAWDAWQVFQYEDVQRVLSNWEDFSSNFGGPSGQDPFSASMISMDPPRHRQLRSIVTQAFTPRAVAQLSDRITAIVTEILDKAAPNGRMDIVDDLSYPLPVIVIAELLGIPNEDRAKFKAWSDSMVGASFSGGNAVMEMSAYFLQMIEQRRVESRNDLISALLSAQIDGTHLNQIEMLGFCVLLLVAGNETTTNLIGNALVCFDEQPEVMEELRAKPDLIPGAVEEVLRFRSPVQMMYRTAARDVELKGRAIRKGQSVMAQIGSANRDDAQFPEADRFDIHRTPNRHIAFGHGIHFCLGAPLARLEAKITLELLLDKFTDIRRDRSKPLQATGSDIVYGVKHLPVTFQARG